MNEFTQIRRFISVGVINTLVDISLFALFYNVFGFNLILANTLSTSAALATSFVLNSRYTFKNAGKSFRTISLFIGITIIGLWVLQPIFITLVEPLIRSIIPNHEISIIIAKIGSIVITLTWNYLWYSKVVFRKQPV